MANTGFGLRPVRRKNGAPWTGAFNWYFCPASDGTALFVGDAVKSNATGAAASLPAAQGYPECIIAAAGDLLRGVVIAFSAIPPSDNGTKALAPSSTDPGLIVYRPASTAMWVAVVDDPDVIFEVMEDGVSASIDEQDIGKNADLVVGAGSTTTGVSSMMLDSSTAATASAQLRILRLAGSVKGSYKLSDNTAGNANVFEVYINEHEFAQGQTTGTGT